MMKLKTKKLFARVLLMMMFALVPLGFIDPVVAYAKPDPSTSETETQTKPTDPPKDDIPTDLNEFDVKIDESGKITTSFDNDKNKQVKTWQIILAKYKIVFVGIGGVATITFGIFFVVNCLHLGAASDNPQKRREAVNGILWCGIGTALCGSATLVLALFWNALK